MSTFTKSALIATVLASASLMASAAVAPAARIGAQGEQLVTLQDGGTLHIYKDGKMARGECLWSSNRRDTRSTVACAKRQHYHHEWRRGRPLVGRKISAEPSLRPLPTQVAVRPDVALPLQTPRYCPIGVFFRPAAGGLALIFQNGANFDSNASPQSGQVCTPILQNAYVDIFARRAKIRFWLFEFHKVGTDHFDSPEAKA